ncbi:MAG: hypothetical protein AB4206_14765 [Xenococcaceae cyanobacterium]
MFDNWIATISSLLFVIPISSQIINAKHIHALPGLTSRDNPLNNLDDPQPSLREPDFSRDDEPILRWCAPIGLGLENIEPENTKPNNSSNTSDKIGTVRSDDCISDFDEIEPSEE